MNLQQKNQLLDKLSVTYNRTNYLRLLCDEAGMAEEAAQFARRKERLGLEIDGLLRDLLQAWMGQAVQVKGQIDAANRAVDQAIKDIERDIDTAGNIVRAVGYIDNVVKIAADLVT